jgi:hypothetical protein
MDYYQANFQLNRAYHFEFDKLPELSKSFSTFKKLVDAVILLMKQRFGPAMDILVDLKCKDDSYFNDLIYAFRAYGYIN